MLLRASLCSALFLATGLSAQSGGHTPAAPGGAATRTAQQEVESLIAAARTGNAAAFWEWLPQSYQRDVEGMVHDLANRVDAKVYERSMAVALRIANLAIEKQDFFFANPHVARSFAQTPSKMRPTKQTFRTVMKLVREVASSDLRTIEGLKSFDGSEFMRKSGKSILKGLFAVAAAQGNDALDELEHASVKTVRQDSRRARLQLRSRGKAVEIEDYLLVEGRWLPVEMAQDWRSSMPGIRKKIASLPRGGDKRLMAQARLILGTVETFVRKFEDAETQRDFDEVMQEVMRLSERRKQQRRR